MLPFRDLFESVSWPFGRVTCISHFFFLASDCLTGDATTTREKKTLEVTSERAIPVTSTDESHGKFCFHLCINPKKSNLPIRQI